MSENGTQDQGAWNEPWYVFERLDEIARRSKCFQD